MTSAASTYDDFRAIAPPGVTNAQATAVAIGSVSQMDEIEGALYSTGPAYWSYAFRKDDICRPVVAVHGGEKVRSSGFSRSSPHMNGYYSSPATPRRSSQASMLSAFRNNEGHLLPSVDVYGAPDFNAMIAAAMYDSVKNNWDYIMETQYGVGADYKGNLWQGMTTFPAMVQKTPGSGKHKNQSPLYNSLSSTPTTATRRGSYMDLEEVPTPRQKVRFSQDVSNVAKRRGSNSIIRYPYSRGRGGSGKRVTDYVMSFFDSAKAVPTDTSTTKRKTSKFRAFC